MKDLNETDVSTSTFMNMDYSGPALSTNFEQFSTGTPSIEESMEEFLLSYNNLAVVANSIEDVALVMKEPTDIKPIITSNNPINEITESKKGAHSTNDDFNSDLLQFRNIKDSDEHEFENRQVIVCTLKAVSMMEESNTKEIQKSSADELKQKITDDKNEQLGHDNIPTVKEEIESTLPNITILEDSNFKKRQKSSEDEQLGHDSITIVKEEIESTLPSSDQISIMEESNSKENQKNSDDKLMQKKVAIILYIYSSLAQISNVC